VTRTLSSEPTIPQPRSGWRGAEADMDTGVVSLLIDLQVVAHGVRAPKIAVPILTSVAPSWMATRIVAHAMDNRAAGCPATIDFLEQSGQTPEIGPGISGSRCRAV